MGIITSSIWVRLVIYAVAIVVALYVIFVPRFWGSTLNRFIFFPDKRSYELRDNILFLKKHFQVDYECLKIPTENGEKLNAWLFLLPHAKKIALVSHGNAGNICYRLPLANMLLASGLSVLLYDYEGYGESSGKPTVTNVVNDGVAAFDYLVKEKNWQPENIVLYGESLGTGVTCELARKRKPGGLILQSGFYSLCQTGRDLIAWLKLYPDCLFPEPHMNNALTLSQPHPPVLIMHGMVDNILNYHNSEKLMAESVPPKQLLLLPHAGHNDIVAKNGHEMAVAINAFLDKLETP